MKHKNIVACIAAAALVAAAGWAGKSASAQEQQDTQATKPLQKDYLQRSLEIYEFRKAAASGPERGQEIFYYKCWFCHNEYTKDIPKLEGLYKKSNLLSGQPVSDDSVKEQIRNGSSGMAAYKYALSEADLNDLVSYLREKCCWSSDAPPPNPRYRAN